MTAFALVLALALGAGYGLGSVLGPDEPDRAGGPGVVELEEAADH
ncbi:hypothetical protein [Georgenia sp. H159]|nr:hypothetical protein [Georgenia sp. H159]